MSLPIGVHEGASGWHAPAVIADKAKIIVERN
jgi:hypothetical protein